MDTDTLVRYYAVKAELTKIKKLEMELRLAILDDIFPNASAGTFNEEFGPFKVKGTFRNNTTIDADAYFDYEDQMTDAERLCINLKPSVIMARYKELDDHETTGLLDEIITVKPATPSIVIELEEE